MGTTGTDGRLFPALIGTPRGAPEDGAARKTEAAHRPGLAHPDGWSGAGGGQPGAPGADPSWVTPPTPRLLPAAPRWALPAVAASALGVLAAALHPALLPGPGQPLLTACLLVATCLALGWRARQAAAEQQVWHRAAVAARAATATAAAAWALDAVAPAPVAALAAGCVPVVAAAVLYGALVNWNRHSSSRADPDDTLNGTGAVLVLVALLQTAVELHGGALARAPWWHVLPLVAQLAVAGILLGTAVTAAQLSELRGDRRTWVVAGGLAATTAGSAVALATGGAVLGVGTPWAAAAAALCAAALMRVGAAPMAPADPAASTIGAFVVISAALATAAVAALSGVGALAVGCALGAAAASSLRMVLDAHDLSHLAASRAEALTDDLTGTANRRAVLRRLEELRSEGAPLVLAVLDLDRFKEVNDALGHSAGDDLLRLVAQRLRPLLGHHDLLGRLGGDEFAVLLAVPPGPGHERRLAAATRDLGTQVLAALEEAFVLGGMRVHTSVSVGVTASPAEDGEPDGEPADAAALLRQADAAMYDAKRSGSGAVLYEASRHGDTSGLLGLAEDLREALDRRQIVLHYQPQVDVGTGEVAGAEALVRWQHPQLGLLAPGDFLDVAEAHALMGLLTAEVLEQALAQLAAWRRGGAALRLSVNLSASSLLDAGLPQRVADLLHEHAVPPSAVVLEVTESVLLREPERSLAVVAALSDLGVAVSIDDFGTGYSSLTQLRRLPVAELKLDRSFTADLLTDPRAAAIVASTIVLAHSLDLRVVAEGVEDAATLGRLAALGCDESQGFFHSAGLPAADFQRWWARTRARTRLGAQVR